jgi:hypothetical protein
MPLTLIAALIFLSEQTVLVAEDHDRIERCISQQHGTPLCGGSSFQAQKAAIHCGKVARQTTQVSQQWLAVVHLATFTA